MKQIQASAQFLQNNLELLGFGNDKDALIQTVKELFENAFDAILSVIYHHTKNRSSKEQMKEMLRISICESKIGSYLEVICGDTGTGIQTHELIQLCCGAFETTKSATKDINDITSGKYGVGLKAAMLYSQKHIPDAVLKIVTTPKSSEILYVQLRMEPELEIPAIVHRVAQFIVSEEHQAFSGTEMRLLIPCPENILEIQEAAEILVKYFQSLKYTIPKEIGFHFAFNVRNINHQVKSDVSSEDVDQFIQDFGIQLNDIAFVQHEVKDIYTINVMAVVVPSKESVKSLKPSHEYKVRILRYANHVPMINGDNISMCGIIKGVCNGKIWRDMGYYIRQVSCDDFQFLAQNIHQQRNNSMDLSLVPQLVIAIDIFATGKQANSTLKYANLKKNILDTCYKRQVQQCCKKALEELVENGHLLTIQSCKDEEILLQYLPLIGNAVTSMLHHSNSLKYTGNTECNANTFDATRDVKELQTKDSLKLTQLIQQQFLNQLANIETRKLH